MARRKRKGIWLLLVLLAAVAAAGGSLLMPYKGFEGEKILEFARGSSTRGIGDRLASEGIVPTSWQWVLVRALHPTSIVQAGEYRFAARESPWQVFERMAKGDIYYRELRVPEGYSMFDIAEEVEQLGLMSARDFLASARRPGLIHDLAPAAPSLEGFLFPSVYRVTRQTTAAALCKQMTEQFRREWKSLHSNAPVLETVTLASLVEKETSIEGERPLVAGVYTHRLAEGMKLDADPSTAYASRLAGAWSGSLHRSDLDRDHPYNTYRRVGLPPGPIANPGLAALRAALAPVDAGYVYFVAKPDGSGGHNFSKDLASHEQAVQQYRKGKQRAQSARPAGEVPR